MATIGITGGTGLVGKHLLPLLVSKGHSLVIFTRNLSGRAEFVGGRYAHWDAERGQCDTDALKDLDAVIHLAGESVAAKRWTRQQKQKIIDSRVRGTQFLVSMLRTHAPNCKTLIAASALGYYGPDNGQPFTETSPSGNDFLASTCAQWEAEEQKAADFLRTVIMRIGIVLGREGGAFPEFAKPLSFGIMPVLSSGKQTISWIHVNDLARLFVYALGNGSMRGIYNAVSPTPVSNKQLMQELARAKGGMFLPIPVPSFIVKMLLGEMSTEVLKSCTVSAAKTLESGFRFNYQGIRGALSNLVKR